MTRSPTLVTWPKETEASQSMPMWMCRGLGAARHLELAAARRAAADEDGVEAVAQHGAHRLDALAAAEAHAEVEHTLRLLVDHRFGQAEFGIWSA